MTIKGTLIGDTETLKLEEAQIYFEDKFEKAYRRKNGSGQKVLNKFIHKTLAGASERDKFLIMLRSKYFQNPELLARSLFETSSLDVDFISQLLKVGINKTGWKYSDLTSLLNHTDFTTELLAVTVNNTYDTNDALNVLDLRKDSLSFNDISFLYKTFSSSKLNSASFNSEFGWGNNSNCSTVEDFLLKQAFILQPEIPESWVEYMVKINR